LWLSHLCHRLQETPGQKQKLYIHLKKITFMITSTFRVVACGEIEAYTTSTGNQSQKRQLRLQEFGGWNGNDNQAARISNGIVATMFSNLAQCMFYPNDIVLASLRFSAREYQGSWFQDVTVVDVHKLSQNSQVF
jgi:hypothetical protein